LGSSKIHQASNLSGQKKYEKERFSSLTGKVEDYSLRSGSLAPKQVEEKSVWKEAMSKCFLIVLVGILGSFAQTLTKVNCSDGLGSKNFDLGRVIFLCLGQPALNLENFPLKSPNLSIFFPGIIKISSCQVKKIPGSMVGWPLIYCGSNVC